MWHRLKKYKATKMNRKNISCLGTLVAFAGGMVIGAYANSLEQLFFMLGVSIFSFAFGVIYNMAIQTDLLIHP